MLSYSVKNVPLIHSLIYLICKCEANSIILDLTLCTVIFFFLDLLLLLLSLFFNQQFFLDFFFKFLGISTLKLRRFLLYLGDFFYFLFILKLQFEVIL
jgi:hypothetical protein